MKNLYCKFRLYFKRAAAHELFYWTIPAIILFSAASLPTDYFEISKNLDIFNAVYRELNGAYVDGTKPGQLMKTGIDAMLGSLDPYTVYYSENDIEDYRFMTTGEYGGIGATVNDINGKVMITEPFEGFTAWKAGIRAGDEIIAVNGRSMEGRTSEETGSLLKGQAGTSLKLKILKPGQKAPVEISLVREEIKTKAVPYYGRLGNSETGYIKLVTFTENCSNAVKEALTDLKTRGCKNLILDLRGNLGGLLMEAVNIVNLFIDKGQEVVFTKGRLSEWEKSYLAVHNAVDTAIPLVILVDENSASASEIVSGALQDLDRAVVIGKRTYGKGLVQQTKELVYNSQIKITVAKYYIPSGRCVQALDYSNRDKDGRVEKVPDSLITAFKTRGGRIVYDGAGIMPDIITPEEKLPNILISLVTKYLIFNYATDFFLRNKEIAPVNDFSLGDKDYNGFLGFLKGKNYDYTTKCESSLEELMKNAEEEKYFSDIKTEYKALAEKMKDNKKDDLMKYRPELKKFLEEEIISRYYFQKGRVEFSLKEDEDLKTATELFSDQSKIKTILTRAELPKRPFNLRKKF